VNYYESEQIAAKFNGVVIVEKDIKKIKDAEPVFFVNSCAITSKAEKGSRYAVSIIKKYHPNAEINFVGCASKHQNKLNNAIIAKREKAFIKIQDGCADFCSYCIIPYIRSKICCRNVADVLAEIKAQPPVVKTIILSGINLTYYKHLNELSQNINKPFYFGSLEPNCITKDFLEVLHANSNFIPNFHVCLQSGCDETLSNMNRHYTTAEYLAKINLIRKYFPTARISTDIIVGFPTETDINFDRTLHFIKIINFDKVHIFPFSPRPKTAAFLMKPITNRIIKNRVDKLKSLLYNDNEKKK
jgi:threonylcarbamoyladenosine tRNA methylthiotransferase MtaB